MINVTQAKWYCSEDIVLIENYSEAVASPEKWDCHHRRGIEEGKSKAQLKKEGIYIRRPASELVFLPQSVHMSLHNRGKRLSEEHKKKISLSHRGIRHTEETKERLRQLSLGNKNCLGRHLSEEHKKKIGLSKRGNKWNVGMKFWNDGTRNIRARECPPGFSPGRIKRAAS